MKHDDLQSQSPSRVIVNELAAQTTAQILLETGAVLIRPNDPFTLTSGRKSPVYVDCRKLISYPRARKQLIQMMTQKIYSDVGFESINVVAGGETAGIPYAAWMAEKMEVPMLYVRKKPKGFGRMAQIEGTFHEGDHVLLVEDMATDGGSKMIFVDALREAGAKINHCVVVFHYGIYPEGMELLSSHGITLHALATWWDIFDYAEKNHILDKESLIKLRNFLEKPNNF